MATLETAERREALVQHGFCIFEKVLDGAMLQELRTVTDGLLDSAPPAELDYVRYQGSNIPVAYQHPVFARLFAWPATLQALASMGFTDPRLLSGHLLSKPPHGPALYWHQDWAVSQAAS